jgi:valyl-tRNA synthetase
MIARYPKMQKRQRDAAAEADIEPVMAVISGIRSIRSEFQIPPSRTLSVVVKPTPAAEPLLRGESAAIGALAKADLRVEPGAQRAADAVLKVVEGSEIHVSLAGVIDVAAERGRLGRELRKVEEDLARTEAKLGREDFRARAPAEVVAREESRRTEQMALLATLREGLARLDALDAR